MPEIFESLDSIKVEYQDGGLHIAVGTFDGVHHAHARLLGRVAGEAHATNGKAMVFTFQNHPRAIINPEHCPKLLTPWQYKKELLSKLPLDYIVGIEFNQEFASISAEEFIHDILISRCHAKTIHSGKNFRFGKGGFGGPGMLEEYSRIHGYRYEQLELLTEDNRRISSTRIREHLLQNKITEVTKLLGRHHQITAPVISGDQLGRTIGFPTANLEIDSSIAYPGMGVFAGMVSIDGQEAGIPAMANHGTRPTVKGTETRFEVHLIGWEGDLTGKEITFAVHEFLRPEKKFDGLDQLKEQLAKDRENALAVLRK